MSTGSDFNFNTSLSLSGGSGITYTPPSNFSTLGGTASVYSPGYSPGSSPLNLSSTYYSPTQNPYTLPSYASSLRSPASNTSWLSGSISLTIRPDGGYGFNYGNAARDISTEYLNTFSSLNRGSNISYYNPRLGLGADDTQDRTFIRAGATTTKGTYVAPKPETIDDIIADITAPPESRRFVLSANVPATPAGGELKAPVETTVGLSGIEPPKTPVERANSIAAGAKPSESERAGRSGYDYEMDYQDRVRAEIANDPVLKQAGFFETSTPGVYRDSSGGEYRLTARKQAEQVEDGSFRYGVDFSFERRPPTISERLASSSVWQAAAKAVATANQTESGKNQTEVGATKVPYSELLNPGLLSATESLRANIKDLQEEANRLAKDPNSRRDFNAINVEINQKRDQLSVDEKYIKDIDGLFRDIPLPANPTSDDMIKALSQSVLDSRGIRLASDAGAQSKLEYDSVVREFERIVSRTINSRSLEGIDALPVAGDTLFSSYFARRDQEIRDSVSGPIQTTQLVNLPFGYSWDNKASLEKLRGFYVQAYDKQSAAAGSTDRLAVDYKNNIETLDLMIAGAPTRASAKAAINAPLAYVKGNGGEAAGFLQKASAETLAAYSRELAGNPGLIDLQAQLKAARDEHASGAITNEQLSEALNAYSTGVINLAASTDPILENTWYGQRRVSGMDFSFEKLAGISALVLGLYESTYGKERDRRKNLEDMMKLERFRTDEALRLYGGRLGLQQQYGGGGGGGSAPQSGPAPQGSSSLASIADRVS